MGKDVTVTRRLLPLLRPYPWAIPVVVILGMLASLFEGLGISLFIPVLLGLMLDGEPRTSSTILKTLYDLVDKIPTSSRLWIVPFLILSCIIIKNMLAYGNHMLSVWLQSDISHRLRSRVYLQLLTVGYNYLESQNSGKILNTLGGETWRTGEAVGKLVGLITTICTSIVYVGILVMISLPLTAVVALTMSCISFLVRLLMRSADRLGQDTVQANARLGLRMYEGIIGMRTIRNFGREGYEHQRFDNDSQQVRRAFLRLEVLSGGVQPLYEVLSALMVLVILTVAVNYDRDFLPALLTFLFMLYRMQPQMQILESYRTGLRGLCGSIDDVLDVIDPRGKPYVPSGELPIKALDCAIRFEKVSFRYQAQTDLALENLSLSIPLGQTTAVVGPSGAGKSTLIHLICRLYHPTSGEIWVNDQPLSKFNLMDWRNNIAIVSQDVHIFNATVADNIAYGMPGATTEDIKTAAQQANADDFICKMPLGYHSVVGDRGLRLSGGQRQRLALARAIVRKPTLLILDEATNALDSISEHLIQEALALFSKNRTVIIIAHRLSTIEQADQIVVLDRGRIIESGKFNELLTKKGFFQKMHSLQKTSLKS